MLKTASVLAFVGCLCATVLLSSWVNSGCGDVWGFSFGPPPYTVSRKKMDWMSRIRLPTPLQLEGYDLLTLSTSVSQLWNEHAQFLNIFSTIKEGVVAVDENRRVVMMNHAARRIFGKGQRDSIDTIDDSKLPESVIAAIEAGLDGQIYEGIWKKGTKPRRSYYNLLPFPHNPKVVYW